MKDQNKNSENNLPDKLTLINIEWLQYFVIASEEGNLTAASELLHITRQALSKSILNIEEQLGIKLIERSRQGIILTGTGKLFLEKAKTVLQNFYDIESSFNEIKHGEPKGIIKIGWSSLWGLEILANLLAPFTKQFPGVFPKIYHLSASEIEKLLSSGDIHVGLLSNQPEKEELDFFKGIEFPLVIVGKPQLPKKWSDLSYIDFKSWNSQPNQDNNWPNKKYPRKIIAEVSNLQMAIKLCEAGLGAIFVSEQLVKGNIEKGSLAIISTPPEEITNNLYISWNKNLYLNSLVYEFLKLLKKFFNSQISVKKLNNQQ